MHVGLPRTLHNPPCFPSAPLLHGPCATSEDLKLIPPRLMSSATRLVHRKRATAKSSAVRYPLYPAAAAAYCLVDTSMYDFPAPQASGLIVRHAMLYEGAVGTIACAATAIRCINPSASITSPILAQKFQSTASQRHSGDGTQTESIEDNLIPDITVPCHPEPSSSVPAPPLRPSSKPVSPTQPSASCINAAIDGGPPHIRARASAHSLPGARPMNVMHQERIQARVGTAAGLDEIARCGWSCGLGSTYPSIPLSSSITQTLS